MPSPTTGTVTLTSSGVSAQIPLDPTARATTVMMTGTITSTSTQGVTANVTIQATLQPWLPAGVTQNWQNVSTQAYTLAVGSTTATALSNDGAFITMLGPIAGLRLSSTTWNPAIVTGTLSLKALQSLTAGP